MPQFPRLSISCGLCSKHMSHTWLSTGWRHPKGPLSSCIGDNSWTLCRAPIHPPHGAPGKELVPHERVHPLPTVPGQVLPALSLQALDAVVTRQLWTQMQARCHRTIPAFPGGRRYKTDLAENPCTRVRTVQGGGRLVLQSHRGILLGPEKERSQPCTPQPEEPWKRRGDRHKAHVVRPPLPGHDQNSKSTLQGPGEGAVPPLHLGVGGIAPELCP